MMEEEKATSSGADGYAVASSSGLTDELSRRLTFRDQVHMIVSVQLDLRLRGGLFR
jgi:hypothetical protein